MEWHGDIIVCANLQSEFSIEDIVVSRQHNDSDVWTSPEFRSKRQPVLAWHDDVKQNDVDEFVNCARIARPFAAQADPVCRAVGRAYLGGGWLKKPYTAADLAEKVARSLANSQLLSMSALD